MVNACRHRGAALVDDGTTGSGLVMERIQRNLESGALPEIVYGRNETPLIHLHRSINDALAAAGRGPES